MHVRPRRDQDTKLGFHDRSGREGGVDETTEIAMQRSRNKIFPPSLDFQRDVLAIPACFVLALDVRVRDAAGSGSSLPCAMLSSESDEGFWAAGR